MHFLSSTPLNLTILFMFASLTLDNAFATANVQHTLQTTMSAYSSTEDQTDDTPRITATGQEVREGIIAVSPDLLETQLPYGTKVKVINLRSDEQGCGGFDTGVLEVQDTMGADKTNQVDLWLPTREAALEWGKCTVTLEVIAYE